MKRLLALLLALICCLSLCACGAEEEEESVVDKVRSAVRSHIMVEITLFYDTTGVPNITMFVDENSDGSYEVTGKVTVKDKYGDSYTGKYDAEVTYNKSTDKCDVDLDLGDLYKD